MQTETKKRHDRSVFGGPELRSFLKEKRPDLYERYKNPSPKMRLGMNLYQERTKLGLTQKKLAALAGIGFSTYQRIEEAQMVANPKMDVIEKLAKALKVEMQDLWKPIKL